MQQRLFPARFVSGANNLGRWTRRWATAAALSLLFLSGTELGLAAPAANSKSHVKVYLMRGFANVFSLGMDEMAARLEARGIPAEAYNHLLASALAAEAAADYKSGKTKTIILVGHSMGGEAVVSMVEALGQAGVPVALAVTLDISTETVTDGKVGNFLNLYVGTGALKAGPRFRGRMTNVDISKKRPGVEHMTIDKDKVIQDLIISNINQAIGGGGRQAMGSAQ